MTLTWILTLTLSLGLSLASGDLQLVEDVSGLRTMTYVHMGQTYSISYKPAAAAKCWDFTDKSYSTGGVVQTGTYCR